MVTTGAVRAWPPLAVALGCAAAYAVFFVLPFYANHLDQYPPAEAAGGLHDPKDLWPYDTALGGFVFGTGGLLTLTCGPLVATTTVVWAGLALWRTRSDRAPRARVLLLLAAAVALGPLVWLASPTGSVVVQWWLD
ncbi:hypothetical protein ACT8ZV_18480 [Nocardioides sp. MAHUQ-72]|uniref:hypothetical protein n=1 Tax=unclassified Nocardioides TaxID=2615069 RepID=UPI003606A3BC